MSFDKIIRGVQTTKIDINPENIEILNSALARFKPFLRSPLSDESAT
jgi:hypothetical protein